MGYQNQNYHVWVLFSLFLIFNAPPTLVFAEIEFLGTSNNRTVDLVVYQTPTHETYVYAAQGASIAVLKVDAVDQVQEVYRFIPTNDAVFDLFLHGTLLYAANGASGINCYSLENPQLPKCLYTITSQSHVVLVGDNSLVSINKSPGGSGGSSRPVAHQIMIDISNPATPQIIHEEIFPTYRSWAVPTYLTVRNVSQNSSSQDHFFYSDPYGIIREDQTGKHSYIGVPNSPKQTGMIINGLYVYLTLPDYLQVYDYQTAQLLESIPLDGAVYSSAILDGTSLYIQTSIHTRLYSLTDPSSPRYSHSFQSPFQIHTIVDGIAYGALHEAGVGIAHLNHPLNPTPFYYTPGQFRIDNVKTNGNIFLAQSIGEGTPNQHYFLLSHQDGANFDVLSQLDIPNPNDLGEFYIGDTIAAVSTKEGLQIVDISDPRNPQNAAVLPHLHFYYYSEMKRHLFVTIQNGYLHVNDWDFEGDERGWYIYSLADPYNPELIKKEPYNDLIRVDRSVFYDDKYYTMQTDGTLATYDFSTPSSPKQTAAFKPGTYTIFDIQQLAVHENKLAVLSLTQDNSIIHVLDIHDINNPVLQHRIKMPQYIILSTIALTDSYLWGLQARYFMSYGQPNLQIYHINIEQPDNQESITTGQMLFNDYQLKMITQNGTLFFHTGEKGILVFRSPMKSGISPIWDQYK